MTTVGLEVSPQPRGKTGVVSCGYCMRRLANEYFFTCLRCKDSYCYIHMSRHKPAMCARRQVRLSRVPRQPNEELDRERSVPLLAAGRRPADRSSANV